MIVYGSTISPFVRKVMAVAAEKGIDVTLKRIGLGDADPAFREASPLGKMPALRDGDFTLADSTAIAFYMDAVGGGPALIPDDPKDRARMLWWDEFADTELFGCLQPMFFNRVVRPLFLKQPGDEAAAAKAEARLPALLAYLEGAMPDADGFFVGGRLTLADLAVASPFVNLAHVGGDLGPYPRTAAWLAAIHARASFAPMIAQEVAFVARMRAATAA